MGSRDYRKGEKDEIMFKIIRCTLLTEKQWEEFSYLFEQLFPGFLDRLRYAHPELTPAETRYIALFLLKRSNKEMAKVLGVTDGALRTVRYRLKKKLDFNTDEQLLHILSGI